MLIFLSNVEKKSDLSFNINISREEKSKINMVLFLSKFSTIKKC
jgi:hypothetical protein